MGYKDRGDSKYTFKSYESPDEEDEDFDLDDIYVDNEGYGEGFSERLVPSKRRT
jgi:hypothetical protein